MIFRAIFWISIITILYTYLGYPLLLGLLSYIRRRPISRGDYTAPITIIVPVYNEEKQIKHKLENCLELDYPRESLEILVVSDCSTDSSDQIVHSFARQGVRLLRLENRRGKHYAQGEALKIARGEIIIFTDASIMLPSDSLRLVMRNFHDPHVGCVSSTDQIVESSGGSNAEGLYIRYDMLLRHLESISGSTTGMSGSFYAARKRLCEKWYPDMSNDFYIPLVAVLNGYRAILDDEVSGYYKIASSYRQEFTRKVRTIVHGLQVIFAFNRVLNPFHHGIYWIKIVSHKLCRWLVPFFLMAILVSNIFLLKAGLLYRILFGAQMLVYMLFILGGLIPSLRKYLPIKAAYFFTVVNLSILVAWYKYLKGEKYTSWEPTRR